MGYWANFLFKIGYYPIEHASVKREFLDWYYQAAGDRRVIEGLDVDNSELSRLAMEAANRAENLDEEHELIELIDIIDEQKERASTLLNYGYLGCTILGIGLIGAGVTSLEGLLVESATIILGAGVAGIANLIFGIYKVLTHQIKSNIQLQRMFNENLTEKPGNVRKYDRRWQQLAAQFFWNKSLISPKTLIAILLLSIIRTLSKRIYGYIAADLHYNITEFIGLEAKEVIRQQLQRAKTGDFELYKYD